MERHRESRAGSELNTKRNQGIAKLADFPLSVWTLVKNPTYSFILAATVCETFNTAYLSAFGPKYVESMFTITSGNAALLLGEYANK